MSLSISLLVGAPNMFFPVSVICRLQSIQVIFEFQCQSVNLAKTFFHSANAHKVKVLLTLVLFVDFYLFCDRGIGFVIVGSTFLLEVGFVTVGSALLLPDRLCSCQVGFVIVGSALFLWDGFCSCGVGSFSMGSASPA